jgi:hypothetical protein
MLAVTVLAAAATLASRLVLDNAELAVLVLMAVDATLVIKAVPTFRAHLLANVSMSTMTKATVCAASMKAVSSPAKTAPKTMVPVDHWRKIFFAELWNFLEWMAETRKGTRPSMVQYIRQPTVVSVHAMPSLLAKLASNSAT